jgi:osmotically-inducible protein OsmY
MQSIARNVSQRIRSYLDEHLFNLYAIITITAAICILTFTLPVHAKQISDVDITSAIETELFKDRAVPADKIDVKTDQGVVTYTGAVNTILAKDRAEKIAESIVGVRAVVNRINVEPGVSCSDAKLKKDVDNALLLDPATDSYEITPIVSNGVVTLTGEVDSWQEKELSTAVTKGVRCVKDIRNDLTVKYRMDRSDLEIKTEIEGRLLNDVRVDDNLITVKVENGNVLLSGTVGSLAEKSRAVLDAYLHGVKSVNSVPLKIEWWARDKMRRKEINETRSDDQIKKAVKDAFLYDPRVFSLNPDVYVDNGTVTLVGLVNNLRAKKAAKQDARNVIGVWRVKNHLKVRPPNVPSNGELVKRVGTALTLNPLVNRFEINIRATAGRVYLSGDVTTSFEKNEAERVAENVKGVIEVINNINYPDTWNWKSDKEIRENVKDELFWSPFVDEDQVNVSVFDGVVTLTGNVETLSERMAAEENAYEGGARKVKNKLTVNHPYFGPHYP